MRAPVRVERPHICWGVVVDRIDDILSRAHRAPLYSQRGSRVLRYDTWPCGCQVTWSNEVVVGSIPGNTLATVDACCATHERVLSSAVKGVR